jgi:hypothetical protein
MIYKMTETQELIFPDFNTLAYRLAYLIFVVTPLKFEDDISKYNEKDSDVTDLWDGKSLVSEESNV